MIYYGIDNGCTGSVGVIDHEGVAHLLKMPVKTDLNYQKTKVKHITRIDVRAFRELLRGFLEKGRLTDHSDEKVLCRAVLERPMVNPKRFQATTSALRALEATLIVLESLGIGYEYCDSKEWQRALLPFIKVQDKKDYPAKLKQVSLEVGQRLFPDIDWEGFKDADGLLIAEWLRRR